MVVREGEPAPACRDGARDIEHGAVGISGDLRGKEILDRIPVVLVEALHVRGDDLNRFLRRQKEVVDMAVHILDLKL